MGDLERATIAWGYIICVWVISLYSLHNKKAVWEHVRYVVPVFKHQNELRILWNHQHHFESYMNSFIVVVLVYLFFVATWRQQSHLRTWMNMEPKWLPGYKMTWLLWIVGPTECAHCRLPSTELASFPCSSHLIWMEIIIQSCDLWYFPNVFQIMVVKRAISHWLSR